MSIFLGIGTNTGDREQNLIDAVSNLSDNKEICLLKTSSIFETEPVGYEAQPWFLNIVLELSTKFEPISLLATVKRIEKKMGRKEKFRWGPRNIDIDILSYEDRIMKSDKLIIPHARMHLRRFVLIPLAEIAPAFIHPEMKLTVQQMLIQCPDYGVIRYKTFHRIEREQIEI